MAAQVRKGRVLAAAGPFVSRVVDGDSSAAWERSDVGTALLIESHIPPRDGTRPVIQNAIECIGPLGPVSLVVGRGDVGAAFRPVGALGWERLVHPRHGRGIADIAMPRDSINVLVRCRVAEFIDRSSPQAVVVVQHPDRRWYD